MKPYALSLELYWEIDAETPEDAMDKLADMIAYNNETVDTMFWDSMEVREIKPDDMAPSIVTITNIPQDKDK